MIFVGDWPIAYAYRRPPPCVADCYWIWAIGGGEVCYYCGNKRGAM